MWILCTSFNLISHLTWQHTEQNMTICVILIPFYKNERKIEWKNLWKNYQELYQWYVKYNLVEKMPNFSCWYLLLNLALYYYTKKACPNSENWYWINLCPIPRIWKNRKWHSIGLCWGTHPSSVILQASSGSQLFKKPIKDCCSRYFPVCDLQSCVSQQQYCFFFIVITGNVNE